MANNVRRAFAWQSTREEFYFLSAAGVTSDGAGRCRCTLDGRTAISKQPSNDPGLIAWSYVAFNDTLVTAYAGAAGTECRLFQVGSYQIWTVKIDATTYNLRLKKASDESTLGTGATVFTFGTQYDWVIGRDTTSVRLWWGAPPNMTTPEITGAQSGSVDAFQFKTSNVDASAYVEVGVGVLAETDTTADRPDPTTLVGGVLVPITGTPHHDQATWDESGTPKTNAWESVDDRSLPDDDTTYIENPSTASSTFRQTYVTSSPTISNCKAVVQHQRLRATSGTKFTDVYAIFCDGANEIEANIATAFTDTAYGDRAAIINTAPDGSAISQTDLDNMQIGHRWDIGVDATTPRWTSIFAEAVGFDFNAEPAAGGQPILKRHGGSLWPTGAQRIGKGW